MVYKLSNTAERSTIEKEFGVPFKYPKLYKPTEELAGADEVMLSIITMDAPKRISFGIWGMLPENFEGDWKDFQRINNTLLVDENSIASDLWHSLSLDKRRCVIIVTGFYTSLLDNGRLQMYDIQHVSKKPFVLAGIYNQLPDGFLTCSVLTVRSNTFIKNIHDLNGEMPLTLNDENYRAWLRQETTLPEIKKMITTLENSDFEANKINI